MKTILSEAYYQHVPTEQQELLRAFGTVHPREQINLPGIVWSYLLEGQGPETLLILPGGECIGAAQTGSCAPRVQQGPENAWPTIPADPTGFQMRRLHPGEEEYSWLTPFLTP